MAKMPKTSKRPKQPAVSESAADYSATTSSFGLPFFTWVAVALGLGALLGYSTVALNKFHQSDFRGSDE